VILDDGFQHLKLHRDLDVVLVNARNPFGGGRLLRWATCASRSPPCARAHLVIVTHPDRVTAPELAKLRRDIDAPTRRGNPRSAHKSDHVLDCGPRRSIPSPI